MRCLFALFVPVACLMVPAAAATTTFDTPVVLAASQTPGAWYVDRYAPAGFSSPVSFQGDDRLLQQINAGDCQSCRGSSFTSTFYNTQGRKFDLDPGTIMMSADLFIDSSWASTGRRMAGLWGTGFDAGGEVTSFPILEFTSDGGTPRFRAWDGAAGWVNLGLPSGFAYGTWQTLTVSLAATLINYQVGDAAVQVDANGTAYFGNVMFQGHNNAAGVTYDIYWDNLHSTSTAAVPEPGSIVLLGSGAILLAVVRRRH